MTQILVNFAASNYELALIGDIEEVGYGELYRLLYVEGQAARNVTIAPAMRDFLVLFRKLKKAKRLIIHDSQPAVLEHYSVTENNRPCLKKYKFN